MSFGKAPINPQALGSFRQMSGKFAQNKYEKKTRRGIPYFVDMYKPSDVPDTLRLIAGQFPQKDIQKKLGPDGSPLCDEKGDPVYEAVEVISPFIKFTEHYDGKYKKSSICSAGPFANSKDKRDPCHGCDIYWDTVGRDEHGKLTSKRISRQNKYAFAVVDYGKYHKLEQVDAETGRVRMNPQTKEPYFNWVKCPVDACDACRQNVESKTGHATHWPMTWTDLQILRNAELDIGKSCTRCQQPGSIRSLAWYCPQCGEPQLNMATAQLKKDEIQQIVDNVFQCRCGYEGFLSEEFACQHCGPNGSRASLFDVDIQVKSVDVGGKRILQVSAFSYPYTPNFPEELKKPFPLLDRYSPTPLQVQAGLFQVNLPPVNNPVAHRPYR